MPTVRHTVDAEILSSGPCSKEEWLGWQSYPEEVRGLQSQLGPGVTGARDRPPVRGSHWEVSRCLADLP